MTADLEYEIYIPPLAGTKRYRDYTTKEAKQEFEYTESVKTDRVEVIKEVLAGSQVDMNNYKAISDFRVSGIRPLSDFSPDLEGADIMPDGLWLSILFDIGLMIEARWIKENSQLKPSLVRWGGKNYVSYNQREIIGFAKPPYSGFGFSFTGYMIGNYGISLLRSGAQPARGLEGDLQHYAGRYL